MPRGWKCWKAVNIRRRRRATLFTLACFSLGVCCCLIILLPSSNNDSLPGVRALANEDQKNGHVDGLRAILYVASSMKLPIAASTEDRSRDNATSVCAGPWPEHPQCQDKMEWMAKHWQSDGCYAELGVDGGTCSFLRYLSEVENWCPLTTTARTLTTRHKHNATLLLDLEPLLNMMRGNSKLEWISRRITSRLEKWIAAVKQREREISANFTQQRILLHIGALTDNSHFNFAENADHGGPLGELVQWSDLITTLYLLGHDIELSTELNQLRTVLSKNTAFGSPCPPRLGNKYDVIYTDIVGLNQFRKTTKGGLMHYMCTFRILDSFGTEPQFNFRAWKPPEWKMMKDKGQAWGNWGFNPRQFLTLYPHSPDNSFLGFVVGEHLRNVMPVAKKNIALVYGKEYYMWKGKRSYLDVISKYMDIHATVSSLKMKSFKTDTSAIKIPGYVINHGILGNSDLQKLLKEAKVFIGLGFPYEGPAPLEAISHGCFFINPKLSPPPNRLTSTFMKQKPTLRSLTSQNPYAAEFIGEPYVYTINAENLSEVAHNVEAILKKSTPPGHLPFEFTYEGMLQRVSVYLEHQDFCHPHQWPGQHSLISKLSKEEESCKEACYRDGLVCEPELFPLLNTKSALERNFSCSSIETEHSYHGPSYHSINHRCSLQLNKLLLSCVGQAQHVTRLCPCRRYRKGQVSLCHDCTS